MPNDRFEQMLREIGQILAEDNEHPLAGTLLFAEVDKSFVAPSIYKDLGDQVLYRESNLDKLGDALLALWEAEEPDKRWVGIEYVIRDGGFEVTFTYGHEIDPKEDRWDRRDRAIARYFGDKPVVYPPRQKSPETFKL